MDRLTLEEAIAHAKEVAEKNYRGADFESIDSVDNDIKANCIKCAEEHEQLVKWLEELKYYKNLEEQGLLVRLPYNNGTLYSVNYSNKTIAENTIIEIAINDHSKRFSCLDDNLRERKFYDYMIGENVFLTREEAEKKLEEMKNNGSEK